MSDRLQKARAAAESVRFSRDVAPQDELANLRAEFYNVEAMRARNASLHNGIAVSEAVTPIIAAAFQLAWQNLQVPEGTVEGYAYSDREIQASCIQASRERCLVQISSETCNILSKEEIAFVVGHEIGHFLLAHTRQPLQNPTPAYLEKRRSQEISADRIGRIACGSLESALKAMMMMATGLRRDQLRFDAVSHAGQIREIDPDCDLGVDSSTHPPVLIRSRALIRFETSFSSRKDKCLARIDRQIEEELDHYIDRRTRMREKSVRRDLDMWETLKRAVGDNVFDREEQRDFERKFGEDVLQKSRNLLKNMSPKDFESFVDQKITETKAELARLLGGA